MINSQERKGKKKETMYYIFAIKLGIQDVEASNLNLYKDTLQLELNAILFYFKQNRHTKNDAENKIQQ